MVETQDRLQLSHTNQWVSICWLRNCRSLLSNLPSHREGFTIDEIKGSATLHIDEHRKADWSWREKTSHAETPDVPASLLNKAINQWPLDSVRRSNG